MNVKMNPCHTCPFLRPATDEEKGSPYGPSGGWCHRRSEIRGVGSDEVEMGCGEHPETAQQYERFIRRVRFHC